MINNQAYLVHHSSFAWRGGIYHLWRDNSCCGRFDVRLYREYPEGLRCWYGYGATWLEAVVRVLAQASGDRAVMEAEAGG